MFTAQTATKYPYAGLVELPVEIILQIVTYISPPSKSHLRLPFGYTLHRTNLRDGIRDLKNLTLSCMRLYDMLQPTLYTQSGQDDWYALRWGAFHGLTRTMEDSFLAGAPLNWVYDDVDDYHANSYCRCGRFDGGTAWSNNSVCCTLFYEKKPVRSAWTPLLTAIRGGHPEAVEWLLSKGADADWAARPEPGLGEILCPETVKFLLDNEAHFEMGPESLLNSVLAHMSYCKVPQLNWKVPVKLPLFECHTKARVLLSKHQRHDNCHCIPSFDSLNPVDPESTLDCKKVPYGGYRIREVFDFLHEHGLPILSSHLDTETSWRVPPVIKAVRGLNPEAVRLLVDEGADPNARCWLAPVPRGFRSDRRLDGHLPLTYACSMIDDEDGLYEIVLELLKGGASPMLRDLQGLTPLHELSRNTYDEATARLLINFGANANGLDANGWTPLHHVCAQAPPQHPPFRVFASVCVQKRTPLIKLLLSRGADIEARTRQYGQEQAHITDIFGLAATPRAVLSASGSSTLHVHNTADPAIPITQSISGAHKLGCHHICTSRDGRVAASAGFAGELKVWVVDKDTGDWKLHSEVTDQNSKAGETWAIALSEDGKFLAGTTYDGRINVWDIGEEGTPKIREYETGSPGSGSFGMSVDLSRDGKFTASGHQNGSVYLFNNDTGRLASSLPGLAKPVRAVAFSPGNTRLAAAGDSSIIAIYDLKHGEQVGNLTGHSSWITSIDWSDTGEYLLSGAMDGKVKVWSVERYACVATHSETDKALWSVKWLPKTGRSEMFCTAGANRSISFYREATGA
ncbi:Meiotic recombination protein rec14 [Colletotrichum siamense]|uniref:Meiotic recombination protein rec14 n=1 Tax=Colletotrichum siamense TaxID=690259 RepID=A0A9P5BNZ8_COLSI|nr:Meiotic recombination protein rec14 [Colletotrichum siamense]